MLQITMRVAKETVVAIEYTLKDDQGNIIDASGERGPMEYLHGAQNIIPGLEQGVEGLVAGDTKNVLVPPQLGYGEYSEKLLQQVPLTAFGANTPQVGMRFHAARGSTASLYAWLGSGASPVPVYATHHVGVGGIVLNEREEVRPD